MLIYFGQEPMKTAILYWKWTRFNCYFTCYLFVIFKRLFFLVFVIYSFLYFPFIEIKLIRRNSLQWHTLNKLPRRTALHCITEHKALARRPSIQPNITLWCLAWSVRQLLSARCPQCRNLINTNRNNERTHTLTQDKLKHDKYLQIPSLPITTSDTGIRTHDLSIPVRWR